MVDVAAVPDQLEQGVGEAQRPQVLDGLLAKGTALSISFSSLALSRSWPNGLTRLDRRSRASSLKLPPAPALAGT